MRCTGAYPTAWNCRTWLPAGIRFSAYRPSAVVDTRRLVPIAHGERLFAAAPEPKRFVRLAGGHGDAFLADSAAYYGAIQRFVEDLGAPPI